MVFAAQLNVIFKKMKLIDVYFKFTGRLTLKEYWLYWNIPIISLIIIFQIAENNGFNGNESIIKTMNLFLIFVFFSTSVKRLHDLGKSGWWVLLNFIPVIGTILMGAYLSFTPGNKKQDIEINNNITNRSS